MGLHRHKSREMAGRQIFQVITINIIISYFPQNQIGATGFGQRVLKQNSPYHSLKVEKRYP